jgi:phosphoglycerate dehydrogenase-like enzyme
MNGANDGRPLVLLSPKPQSRETIFGSDTWDAFQSAFNVVELDPDTPADAERFDTLLPDANAVVGQPDLPDAKLRHAEHLRAVCNVEGNFFPNVDYTTCAERGMYVLGCGAAYALAVAE